MTTSGTYTTVANLTVAEIIDEAFRRCRISPSMTIADHQWSARLSFDLMLTDWVNDGVQQFIMDRQVQTLAGMPSDISFIAPAGTIDVFDMVFRNATDNDIQIKSISRNDYLDINDKATTGQPITYFVDKTSLPPTVYLWPVQNITGTAVVYNRLRQIQDVGAPTNTVDSTVLYKEAICACLAAKLAEKYADVEKYPTIEKDLLVKAQVAYRRAKNQDRDRSAYIMKPRLGRRFTYGV
jgi:hypothetical protein